MNTMGPCSNWEEVWIVRAQVEKSLYAQNVVRILESWEDVDGKASVLLLLSWHGVALLGE